MFGRETDYNHFDANHDFNKYFVTLMISQAEVYNEDNMPIDFRFVDLQCSKKASPATDLNYFFFTSLDGEFRMTKRDIMTKIYYDSFREVLEKSGRALPFSFQELSRKN
ncbi:hypothetical protein Avbf_08039 [Armadillidium vulgare]|nr:hypothetical protein Avbf_08039 [Armadillidium vulgare]